MIDGLLFVLIIINFAITLTVFLRYNSSREEDRVDEIRREMSEMTAKFNTDAERNIKILEDRITKANHIINKQELMAKAISAKENKELQTRLEKQKKETYNPTSQKKEKEDSIVDPNNRQRVQKYIPKSFEESQQQYNKDLNHVIEQSKLEASNPSIIKINPSQSTNQNTQKSFIQKAYHKPQKNVPIHQAQSLEKDLDSQQTAHQKVTQNDKTHQMARLIGEGKSYEEIAQLLGISLGEIQLFRSIIKKKLVG